MSGHSHWATIRRKKGAADAKKGAVFTRLAREILMAARDGGGDPGMNFRLALAVDRARAQNMPKDSIDRAIKRGTGDAKDGIVMEQVIYEGYGCTWRGHHDRNLHRKSQPHRSRNSARTQQGRRRNGRSRSSRLAVQTRCVFLLRGGRT